VGFLNPPYSQKGKGLDELNFVSNMLGCLKEGSLGFALVPMSCAIQKSSVKEKLLRDNTLVATMSMPDELFYPTAAVPCAMVFRAGVPHDPDVETWFGYWKDDGYIKIKKEGRVDYYNRWENEIKFSWIDMFKSRREIAGKSVKHKVTADDEWCVEAYVDTDYSDLGEEDFINEMKKYTLFSILEAK
jgi:type I restriction-modification system DNA methylase subunit